MMLNRQPFFTFILIFAAGFLVYLLIRDYPKRQEIKNQLGDIATRIAALKKDEEKQKSMAEYLETESYLEKQARLRLNLKKEGEEVVFIYKKDEAGEPPSPRGKTENPFLSKLEEWVRIIRSKF